MRALLLAVGRQTLGAIEWTDTPPALRPVLDRPLVHHVIERLVDRGVTEVVAVTDGHQGLVGAELGDGRRWGCRVTHVAAENEAAAVSAVRQAALASADPLIVLATADRLPLLDDGAFATGELVAIERLDDGSSTWGGCAVLPPKCVADAAAATSMPAFEDRLMAEGLARGTWATTDRWLDARDASTLLASNRRALDTRQQGLLAAGREVEPGIWIGRNVRLGHGVRLVAPAFIGEDTSIGAGSTIGPDVAIGSACVIDADASVERSMVTAGTYVGEGLTVVDAIVDGSTLVNVRLGACVRIDDGLLLAGTT